MKLLLSYLKKYRKVLLGTLVLATINQTFSLLDPQIFRLIIDGYASRATTLPLQQFLSGVTLLLLAAMGVAFVSRVAKNFQDYYVNVITQKIGAELYGQAITHSLALPYSVFEDQRSGEILQKLHKARSDSQILIASFINIIFLSLIGILFVVSYAFTVHWSVGLTYLLVIPILGTTTFIISRRIKKAQAIIIAETAELAGSTTETLRNVELVKSLGLENQETNRLNEVNNLILALELKKVKLIRKLSFIQGTLINALRSIIMLLMLWLIFSQIISLGQFFTLLFYSFFIFNPLSELGNVASQYQEARASLETLETILNLPKAAKPTQPKSAHPIKEVSFSKVDFKYPSADVNSVTDITLKIKNGQTVALVGPSGSGKTTLIKLMVGLYQAQSGALTINNIPASEVDYDDLRKQMGYVSQDTQLFAGTIRENLLFVRPEATDAECLEALKNASALPIIERGDKGLNSKIGEGGIKISGGERQRLAIARAILRQPELIIFDEATSALDSITEKSIAETIHAISHSQPNLITILVAHRLATVIKADIIYVLEKGKLVEQGNHNELLKLGGLYTALWREQGGENI